MSRSRHSSQKFRNFAARARAYECETAERAYTPTNLELSAGADGTALAGAGCVQCADQQVRRLGSMRAGEASSASATFDGTLVITAPSGKQVEAKTTFDTGSDTDAVSVRMATKLIELGCSWGDAGGGRRPFRTWPPLQKGTEKRGSPIPHKNTAPGTGKHRQARRHDFFEK